MSGPDYSDERFEAATTRIEELLADLLGIESAAQVVRDYLVRITLNPDEAGPGSAPKEVLLRARKPFHVYPSLPVPESGPGGTEFSYENWLNGAYEAGAASAGGTGAWLRSLADNYYLVDTAAMIAGATQQADLALQHGTALDEVMADVSGNLATHWSGRAKEDFFAWMPFAYGVPSALLHYADAAQVCVSLCAGAIGGTQAALLAQAEHARDTLEQAVQAWHDDFDQFPFPPGTGWKFKEIGVAIQGKIDEYVAMIPGPDLIVEAVTGKIEGKVLSKLPGSGPVLKAYGILTQLEANEVDVAEQPTAREVLDKLEKSLRAIAREGDQSIAKLDDRISALAAEVASRDVLVLPRLPRDPAGHYDADRTV